MTRQPESDRNSQMLFGRRGGGFTLIEVLVVVSIIALIVSILMPSLRRAREQAKEVTCASNESQFGKGFYMYAAANKGFFCSGSFDPELSKGRDGPVDRVGWVADLVNTKTAFPAKMLCPSNPAKVNQKLGGGGSSGCVPSVYSWSQVDDLIRRGYNTNYTQSWYMGRTQMRSGTRDFNVKRLSATIGPLRDNYLFKVTPARVPLLGDGGLEDIGADEYHGSLDLGKLTVKTMTDGPFEPLYAPQSYSDFGPAHGFNKAVQGKKANPHDRANILFADGHVERFIDRDNDGQFKLDYDANGVLVQLDVDPRVFDGVLTLGRRSLDSFELK